MVVGDPLEKATLTAVDWSLTKGDAVIPKKGKFPDLEKEFEPSLLNSTVYIISMFLQVNNNIS